MPKTLAILLLTYAAASLIHFIHNAEFLADYPHLPTSWTRSGIYLAWIVMTIIGAGGWALVLRGYRLAGLLVLVIYAALGLGSLGHYLAAPPSNHTLMMNVTILLEVIAAALVFTVGLRQMVQLALSRPASHPDM